MLIGIDANEANLTTDRVGINEYAFNLLWALSKLHTDHRFIVYLKDLPKADMPNMNYRVIPFPKLWTQTRLPFDLYTHNPRPDVFFSMTHYAPRWSPIPTVVAIMDLGFLQSPDQFTAKDLTQLKSWTEYSVKQAQKVIAISDFTKKTVVEAYKCDPEDVVVTPLGYKSDIFKPSNNKKKPYILFLSSLKPSKNVEGLIRAYAKLTTKHVRLKIVGKKAWLYDQIFSLVRDLKLEDRVEFLGFVNEQTKVRLMQEAACYVLPSFYEGFGITILEAMACGTPVVVSNVASIPEVAGDAGIYIDPYQIDSITKGLEIALSSFGDKFVQKGLARVKSFNWDKTARDTLAVLESVN